MERRTLRATTVLALVASAACSDEASRDESPEKDVLGLNSGEFTLWPSTAKPAVVADPDGAAVELGVRFKSDVDGVIRGIRYYKSRSNRGTHTAHLWSNGGALLASATFSGESTSGWQTVRFTSPVAITAGVTYVASYHTDVGHYAGDNDYFSGRSVDAQMLHAMADSSGSHNGVYHYGATAFPDASYRASNYWVDVVFKPTTGDAGDAGPPSADAGTTSPADAAPPPSTSDAGTSSGAFPNATNTGVPAGTTLTKYSGPCTITSTTTISNVDASACSAILIHAPNVVITRSLLPRVDATSGGANSVTVSDSTVQAGAWVGGAVWGYNITATRLNVTGGQHSFHCAGNCTVTDSWLHDQYNPDGGSFHNNAFITNGGSNMIVRHNTLHCTAILNSTDGGCTADVSLFGDFDPVTNVTVENNLLKANNSSISYCAYGGYSPSKPYPIATGIRYLNNVFERGPNRKCGVYGPVTSFQSSAAGNEWSGNAFDDGTVITP